jgi:hypothetical protein
LAVALIPDQPPFFKRRLAHLRASAALLAAALFAAAFFAARIRAAFRAASHFFFFAASFRLRRSITALAFERLSARAFAAFNNRMCFAFALSRIFSDGFFDLQIFQPVLVSIQKSEVHLIFPVVFTPPDIIPLYFFPDMVK